MPEKIEKKDALATQQFVEVASVKNGTVVLKSGGLRQILLVDGMNFDLKSEDEQNTIIHLFQSFLNSLNFTVQILVHSRKLNIDAYLENLLARLAQESNELLKQQIQEYHSFVQAFVNENAIMNKSYFVVVPFDPIKIPGVGTSAQGGGFLGFFKKPASAARANQTDHQLDEQIEQIEQRTTQVIAGINRIGLRAVPLEDEELIELFYNLYNPGATEKKDIGIAQSDAPSRPPQ